MSKAMQLQDSLQPVLKHYGLNMFGVNEAADADGLRLSILIKHPILKPDDVGSQLKVYLEAIESSPFVTSIRERFEKEIQARDREFSEKMQEVYAREEEYEKKINELKKYKNYYDLQKELK